MFESMKRGMSNTRTKFTERMNILFDRGPKVDEEFWDGLEEALILSDVGAKAAFDIVERMRDTATRRALPDAYAVMDALTEEIAATFATSEVNIFDENPVLVLFVGINGAGKTTTVGKIANAAKRAGRNVLLGSADTFRAAAIEQLEEWGRRSDVEIVQRERGADPASVCYDTIERAEATGADFVLIDTAGRLHTSDDLMRELGKVVGVVRKRSKIPVRTALVIDATTGQNGLSQARLFNQELDLDALIITKLDGTAKGGIALAVSHELGLPIAMIGVGEGLTDLQVFEAEEFAAALIGAEPVVEEAPAASQPAEVQPAETQPAEPVAEEVQPAAAEGPSDDGAATAAPSVEDSDARFAEPESSSFAPLPGAFEEADAQLEEDGAQTVAAPSSEGTPGAETDGVSSATDDSLDGWDDDASASIEQEISGAHVADSSGDGSSFSWKDDFGNPDEMVDALGAQRELTVVTEEAEPAESPSDLADEVEEPVSVEGEVADAAPEPEEKKEGLFKRAWRWLSE